MKASEQRTVMEAAKKGMIDMNNERMGAVLRRGVYENDGCPKCGAPAQAFTRQWHAGYDDRNPEDPCKLRGDHLHMTCQACGAPWMEQTKDGSLEINPKASPIGATWRDASGRSPEVVETPTGVHSIGLETEA